MGCAAAPCGKCFQSLLKSAICPHDGPAALGRIQGAVISREIWKRENSKNGVF